ncbi:hypothetical protein LB561_19835 [Mesorhizobium sp. B292B1B]|uniref:hypothetical protein n=1 Tax=unclassified Mesorhizobium TaxID=325217 RepID=UPI001CD18166|nr:MULTISPECIES: hypothetical protein [unclassified Mesorhizobium]MCA0015027.1 hypothetical protein [Mesorhizobium sp. B294B1A1]MCA0039531.1 hypothetical protein [Mesorhizobium sp. B292B1B]
MTRARGLEAIPSDTARAAVEGADIVVTTVALVPEPERFLDANWLKPGSFTAITDRALPWLPETMRRFGRIVVDDLEQEKRCPNRWSTRAGRRRPNRPGLRRLCGATEHG